MRQVRFKFRWVVVCLALAANLVGTAAVRADMPEIRPPIPSSSVVQPTPASFWEVLQTAVDVALEMQFTIG